MTDQLRPTDPRQIGPYRLTGHLGGGGMGEVFLGKSAGGRRVAVKVIRPELAADHEFRTRFRREVAAARRVNGLYTALVAGADAEGPVPWLATAYIKGPSLEAAVEEHGPLPARSVLALAAGLAEGLDAVHAVGLVHRDIKPSNVLLAADGPRLIDFGIAWDPQSTVLTAAGTVFGSPEYMSPEYATGRPFGPPADVFSLGGVLVYAAAGRPPFEGSSLATIVGRIVHETPDLSAVPPAVATIAAWCLAKDPAERPTPKELVARLGDAGLRDDWLPRPLLADLADSRPGPTSPRGRRQPDRPPGPRRQHDRDTHTIPVSPTPTPALPAPDQDTTADAVVAPPERRRPALPRVALIGIPALVVIAAAAAGLGLTLGHPPGSRAPAASRSAIAPPTASPIGSATRPAVSPYRFAVAGEAERACSAGLRSAAAGRAASVVFANATKAATVGVSWVTSRGSRSVLIRLKPGVTGRISGDVGDVWELDGPGGCVAEFRTTAAGRVTIEDAKS